MITNDIIMRQGQFNNVGRLGGLFTFADGTNNVYGISNNHVIANLNNANVGDPICDVNNNKIGALQAWVHLYPANSINTTEFAIFKLDDPSQAQWVSWGANARPNGFAIPSVGMHVNYPSPAGISTGRIDLLNYPIQTSWNGVNYIFNGCLRIIPSGITPFSYHGDSGGAIYTDNNMLLGIIVAINENNSATFVVPFFGSILKCAGLNIY